MNPPNLPPQPAAAPSWQYQMQDYQRSKDADHLRLLSIFHYIQGGLVMLFSCLALIYVVFGAVLVSHKGFFQVAPPATMPSGGTLALPPSGFAASNQPPPTAAIGYLMMTIGGVVVLLGWTIGILTIVSGRKIGRRRGLTFSLVMAGVSCLAGVTGIVLGVFTFIVLLRPSVKAEYEWRASNAGGGA